MDKNQFQPPVSPFFKGDTGREFPSDKRGVPLGRSVCQKLCKATKLSLALLWETSNYRLNILQKHNALI